MEGSIRSKSRQCSINRIVIITQLNSNAIRKEIGSRMLLAAHRQSLGQMLSPVPKILALASSPWGAMGNVSPWLTYNTVPEEGFQPLR